LPLRPEKPPLEWKLLPPPLPPLRLLDESESLEIRVRDSVR
jgi:hypothetical protein